MKGQNPQAMENRISRLKQMLASAGNIRPGTLSIQYRNPSEKKIPFNQISFTHKGKSRSEYVRPENLQTVIAEIAEYKRFRIIIDQLVDLSIKAAKLRYAQSNSSKPKTRV